ncbi:MAG TPA: hypothetical protein VK816_01810 [Jatrophihabitantaceae bacterium]|jgi:hypothetical protein|nr:hypothetical protein [Jatrophihabitantaceae bacterium]
MARIRRARSVEAKGDAGPGQWMPPAAGYACAYDQRFIAVLAKYRLPVVAADKTAMLRVLTSCTISGSDR